MAVPVSESRLPGRDDLTGLMGLEEALGALNAWQQAASENTGPAPVHAMLIGIRRFDTINLAYGEPTGNGVLVELAGRIQRFAAEEFGGSWIAARAGGGNFLVALQETCSRERWQWLAEALAEALSAPMIHDVAGGNFRLWPRIALLRCVPPEDAANLFDRLVETLGGLQGQPGRRICWVEGEINLPGRSSAQLETDLMAALDRDEIEIVFQPQFTADGLDLIGAEALARWHHPLLGRIGAVALFAIAERADHVPQLSRHIARRALEAASVWPDGLRLSLNITAADLADRAFAEEMAQLVTGCSFDLERLTLEITEESLVADLKESGRQLSKLVDLGMRLALDDFGAGFCNFRYLKLLPLHYLKLDRIMVDEVASDERDLAVLRAIVAMAHALGLSVIAEGVEREEQRKIVEREGCASFQGFLKAQPMSANEFSEFASR